MRNTIKFFAAVLFMMMLAVPNVKAEAASVSYPKIVVESVTTDGNKVFIGDEVPLHVTLKNMSNKVAVTEVLLTYSSEEDVIVPIEGQSNQVFVSEIKAGEEMAADFSVKVTETKDTFAKINFDIKYVITVFDDLGRPSYSQQTNSSYAVLDIYSEEKVLTISNLSVPVDGALYEKGLISFNYANTATTDITDFKVTVAGLNDNEPEVFSIGDIKSKKTGYFENYITYSVTGNRTVSITFSYTNSDGEEIVSDVAQFVTSVYEKTVTAPDVENVEEDNLDETRGVNLSLVFLGIACILGLMCIFFALSNARKNK